MPDTPKTPKVTSTTAKSTTAKSTTAKSTTAKSTTAKSTTKQATPKAAGRAATGPASGKAKATTATGTKAASATKATDGAKRNGSAAANATAARTAESAANGRGERRDNSTARPHEELLRYRDEFPILARKVYLNSCSLGALSDRSMQAMARFQEQWNEYGAQAWYRLWMGELAALREKFAKLIGAEPTEIALVPNVSSGLSELSTSLDHGLLGKRNKVVLNDMDFPTLAYQWLAKERIGTDVVFSHSSDHMTLSADAYVPLVDDQTALVATSRVFFLSGYIQDIPRIAETAHKHGAFLLVDDYQGTGQIPLDVHRDGVDFLVSGTLKWLMGGPGVGFVYARAELIPKLKPTVTGWWASRDQFEFKTTEFEYRPDAQRLEAGTPATAAICAASAAMDIVLEIGVQRIRERTRYLSDDLIRRVQERGWPIHSPLDSAVRSSIVMLALDRPDEVVSALTERGIIVDYRPGLVRISPHFYNTVEENAAIVSAIDDILKHQTVSAVPDVKGRTTGTRDT